MDTERTFSGRLSQLLKERSMTQKELAEKAEVTEAAMSHYLKGDRIPRSSVLARIANALSTTSDFLMEGTPQAHKEEIIYVKKLIARNVEQMSSEEKAEIVNILFGVRRHLCT